MSFSFRSTTSAHVFEATTWAYSAVTIKNNNVFKKKDQNKQKQQVKQQILPGIDTVLQVAGNLKYTFH